MTPEHPNLTPEALRREADWSERLSGLLSYQPDKAWLCAKADELRRLADRMEARSWRPRDRDSDDAQADPGADL